MKLVEMNEWYESCEFIEENMQFYSKVDFFEKRDDIAYYFAKGDSRLRTLYKWYVFANPNLTMKDKEIIWDYVVLDCLRET